MTSAVLRGREHTRVGGLALMAEGRVAIALSRGGAKKRYPYKDPNEDAAAFAIGDSGLVLAVADGHWGCGAAELVAERVAVELAPEWTRRDVPDLTPRWSQIAGDAMLQLNDAIHADLSAGSLEWPRTTVAIAVVRPDEDLLAFVALGDSPIYCVGENGAREIAARPERRTPYLGDSNDALSGRWRAGTATLAGVRALVLATDGLTEPGVGVEDPLATITACSQVASKTAADLRSLEVTRAVAEQALAAQRRQRAGDNVACAVAWLA